MSGTPPPFDGDWFHSAGEEVVKSIQAVGWRPDLMNGIIYGTAIYLARGRWRQLPWFIQCCVVLGPAEVLMTYPWGDGPGGSSQDDLIRYLKEAGINGAGRTPRKGDSNVNRAIREHFLRRGIKAVHFKEHEVDVVAVYDPTVIQIIRDGLW